MGICWFRKRLSWPPMERVCNNVFSGYRAEFHYCICRMGELHMLHFRSMAIREAVPVVQELAFYQSLSAPSPYLLLSHLHPSPRFISHTSHDQRAAQVI